HNKAIYVCSAMLLVMAVIPGVPGVPFSVLSAGFFFLAGYSVNLAKLKEKNKIIQAEKAAQAERAQDSIESLLHIDTLALEVGVGLIPLVDTRQDGEILERIVSSRKQFAQEMGIVVPMVMVRDNIQLRPGEYQILLKGSVIGRGNLMVDYYMAMDPGDISEPIDGIATKEPAYGLDALWIKAGQRDEATFRGYTVVNCSTVIVTHLTKLIEAHAASRLGRQDTQHLID